MESRPPDDSDERSMRLLQPKLRILYLISKQGKVKNNLSEMSRILGYAKDSHVNTLVHNLLDDEFIKVKKVNEIEFLVLTGKGRRKIAPLVLARFLPLIVVIISMIPAAWGLDELIYGISISPYVLLIAAVSILGIGLLMFYETTILEKEYFRV